MLSFVITTPPWCGGHSTSINVCGVRRVMAGIQVFKSEFYIHIHLNQVRVGILSCKKKKKINVLLIIGQRTKKESTRMKDWGLPQYIYIYIYITNRYFGRWKTGSGRYD